MNSGREVNSETGQLVSARQVKRGRRIGLENVCVLPLNVSKSSFF